MYVSFSPKLKITEHFSQLMYNFFPWYFSDLAFDCRREELLCCMVEKWLKKKKQRENLRFSAISL